MPLSLYRPLGFWHFLLYIIAGYLFGLPVLTLRPCLRKITADCQQNRAPTALEQYKVEHAHMATRYFSL